MSVYTNQEKTSSAKMNSGRKSILTERNHCLLRRTVLKNHRTTAAQVIAELDIHYEDHVFTNGSFTNPICMVGMQLL
jgi:hypothetical protein